MSTGPLRMLSLQYANYINRTLLIHNKSRKGQLTIEFWRASTKHWLQGSKILNSSVPNSYKIETVYCIYNLKVLKKYPKLTISYEDCSANEQCQIDKKKLNSDIWLVFEFLLSINGKKYVKNIIRRDKNDIKIQILCHKIYFLDT